MRDSVSDKVLRLRFNLPIERWVLYFLRSEDGRRQIEELATGNQLSMRNISQSTLRAIRFPLPPDDVRERILRAVEKALSSAARFLADANRASALLGRLDQAILAKAFRGELLTPEEEQSSIVAANDSNDNGREIDVA